MIFLFELYLKSIGLSNYSLNFHAQVIPWCKGDTLDSYSMSLDLITSSVLSEWPSLEAFQDFNNHFNKRCRPSFGASNIHHHRGRGFRPYDPPSSPPSLKFQLLRDF